MQRGLSPYTYKKGLSDGVPIALGYLTVSFGFGILAAAGALKPLTAALISLTNVTSAGQKAGLDIILAAGPLMELIAAEFIINIRYALMSISLTQKLDATFTTLPRLICAFAMTDEIFGVAAAQPGLIGKRYFYGLMFLPIVGWVAGTFLGASAGYFLPASVQAAMGIALYAMFLAIFLPPSTKDHAIALCVGLAALLSVLRCVVPALSGISAGFSVVICAPLAAVAAALVKPVKDDEEGDQAK